MIIGSLPSARVRERERRSLSPTLIKVAQKQSNSNYMLRYLQNALRSQLQRLFILHCVWRGGGGGCLRFHSSSRERTLTRLGERWAWTSQHLPEWARHLWSWFVPFHSENGEEQQSSGWSSKRANGCTTLPTLMFVIYPSWALEKLPNEVASECMFSWRDRVLWWIGYTSKNIEK